MRNTDRWIEQASAELAAREPGTKVLIAIEGFFEPGRECVAGEMLAPPASCGRPNCTCGDGFHGVASHGNASVAQVQRLRGVPRALALATIAASMREHDDFEDADGSAAAFLDEIAEIEEGRLVRREEHILLPFPKRAQIVAAHHIEYRFDDEP